MVQIVTFPTDFSLTKRLTFWTKPERGRNFVISRKSTSEPSWKETIENWKRASANEEQLISFELETLGDSFFAVEVTRDDVEEVISRWTGIPIQSVKQEEAKKLLQIEAELHKRIISQRPAISALGAGDSAFTRRTEKSE